MAIYKYSDFENRISGGANTFGWSNTMARTAPFPVEKYSIFPTLDAAKAYAINEGLAYEGQIIAVTEGNEQIVYVIDTHATNNLRKLATGGDADSVKKLVEELSGTLLSSDGIVDQLSNAISTITATTIPTAINDLSATVSTDILSLSATVSTDIQSLSNTVSTDILSLSNTVSTDIQSLSNTVSTDIQSLSNTVSTDIQSLSATVSAEISAAVVSANNYTDTAVNALSSKLSSAWHFAGVATQDPTIIPEGQTEQQGPGIEGKTTFTNGDIVVFNKPLESGGTTTIEYVYDGTKWTALGDESMNASKTYVDNAIQSLSNTVSTDILSLSNTVSTDILSLSATVSTDIQSLSATVSTDILSLSATVSTDIQSLSATVSAQISAVSTLLSTDLSAERQERISADAYLSTAIDHKIFIKDPSSSADDYKTGKYSDLSVIKCTAAEYAEIIKTDIPSNVMYVVESDYIDAYGQVISNLTMTGQTSADASEAANKTYVDAKVGTAVQDVILNGTTVVSDADHKARLNLSALAFKDKVAVADLASDLSAVISAKAEYDTLVLSVESLSTATKNVSDRLDSVAGNYLSGVSINGVSATVTNNIATFENIVWDCGTSTDL